MTKKVVVAMSGGVDSSVAAALLQQEGYEVVGMMMRLWSEEGRSAQNRCCTPESMGIARQVAGQLRIPFYSVDAQDVFRNTVVEYFLDGHRAGQTPNPCLACNREIRWEYLLNQALNIGADFMATGHYVRITREENEAIRLFEAEDQTKDQSYVLSVLNPTQLKHALFPLGDLTKKEVTQIAVDLGLPAAESKESQDLCFLAGGDYRDFIRRNSPELERPGPILDGNGEQLGEHQGLVNYTIGQRKGIGVTRDVPLYVIEKRQQDNALIVGERDELGRQVLHAGIANWVSGNGPENTFEADVRIRYSAKKTPAEIEIHADGSFSCNFQEPLRDITAGQAAVIYRDGEVLGSAVIQSSEFVLQADELEAEVPA